MKARVSVGAGFAAVFAVAVAASGQQPTQPQTSAASGTGQEVTITGCVQREADYRRAQDAGKGGVAGTGVGAGNEFVLVNASADSTRTGTAAGAQTSTPTGTSGTAGASASAAYEITGPNEGRLADHVGRRVEIRGTLKASETAGGQPTGGATAGQPPRGVDVASKDLKLRELEVTSVREATGTCPAVK
jgi:hypothetical protein